MCMYGIIFDLDGTLLDSMGIWETLPNLYLEKKGLKAKSGLHEIVNSMSIQQAIGYIKDTYRIKDSEERMFLEIQDMISDFYQLEAQEKKGVTSFLQQMVQANITMCIATACERCLVEAVVKRLGWQEYFTGILTCSELKTSKDSPTIYYEGLKLLKTTKENTVVFEDAYHAMLTAGNAGFRVIGVYDDSNQGKTAQIQEVTEKYLGSFEGATVELITKKEQK